MRELLAMTQLPLILPTRVVTRPGYDTDSKILINLDQDWLPDVSDTPSRAEMVNAVQALWSPWRAYQFDSPESRAGMLAAIFTLFARPGLNIAPGFLVDAPCPSSGKTTLFQALLAVVMGEEVGGTLFERQDDSELMKQLLGDVREGVQYFLLDNVTGHFDSPAFAGLLTSSKMSKRILGTNNVFRADLRLMVGLTSNNASISHELSSRLVSVRIDTQSENPQALAFPFSPIQEAISKRAEIAWGVCTVFQAYFNAGSPKLGKGRSRFATWDDLIRQCVLWVQHEGYLLKAGIEDQMLRPFGDPAGSLLSAGSGMDEETSCLRDLLHALKDQYGVLNNFTAAAVASEVNGFPGPIKNAIHGLSPRNGDYPVSSVGKILSNRKDRRVDGLYLKVGKGANHATTFWVMEG
jgi:hypothetical protein